jgi:hypothetical protein
VALLTLYSPLKAPTENQRNELYLKWGNMFYRTRIFTSRRVFTDRSHWRGVQYDITLSKVHEEQLREFARTVVLGKRIPLTKVPKDLVFVQERFYVKPRCPHCGRSS